MGARREREKERERKKERDSAGSSCFIQTHSQFQQNHRLKGQDCCVCWAKAIDWATALATRGSKEEGPQQRFTSRAVIGQ